jgi:putative restriction endonuclease
MSARATAICSAAFIGSGARLDTDSSSWAPNIVTFKTYSASDGDGAIVWQAVQDRLEKVASPILADGVERSRHGEPVLVRRRLGQGAFRIMVTDAYRR